MTEDATIPQITVTPCESSQFEAYGYDETTRTLAVKFKNATYHYFEVPAAVGNGFAEAESKGSYLIQKIKKGGFEYKKLNPALDAYV